MGFNQVEFDRWANDLRGRFESFADTELRHGQPELQSLLEAMRYSVLGGGKRVRALLVYAAGALTGACVDHLDHAALAVECVHAYSLIHDDLPCMDNDTLRRGKPTCHVKFGVAEAMLAGDALQPEAFMHLVGLPIDPEKIRRLVRSLSSASGIDGMCGGQMVDLSHVGKKMTLPQLRSMHLMKTGALIQSAVEMGALCGETNKFEVAQSALNDYAHAIGLGFQVIDDVLDVVSDTSTLGKTVGKDAQNDKPTYVSLLGLDQAKALADDCLSEAVRSIESLENKEFEITQLKPLKDMAYYMIGREN